MSPLVVAVGALFLAGVALLILLVGSDRRRGALAGLAVALLFLASSSNVPPAVVLVVQGASVAVVLVGLALPPSRPNGRSATPLWVVVLMALAIVVTSVAGIQATRVLIPVAAVLVGIAFLASHFSENDKRVFLDVIVAFALLEVGLGIVECFVTGEPVPWGYRSYENGRVFADPNPLIDGALVRVQGTTGHPIPYGSLMAIALVVVLGQWSRFTAPLRAILIVALGAGLVLSGSRSVILAMMIAAIFLVLTSSAADRSLRILVALLMSVLIAVIAFDDIAVLVTKLVSSGSYENRVGALASVPGLLGRGIWESLFGSGVGSQPALYARGLLPQSGFMVIDNEVVTTLATLGIAGVVVLGMIFVTAARNADRTKAATLIVFAVMLFSFDYILWSSMACLLGAFVALPGPRQKRDTSELDSRSTETQDSGTSPSLDSRIMSSPGSWRKNPSRV